MHIYVCMFTWIYIHIYTCRLLYDRLFVHCFAVLVVEYEVNHKTVTQLPTENENRLSCQFNAGLA